MLRDDDETYDSEFKKRCEVCGKEYCASDLFKAFPHYFERPYYYDRECDKICLSCHLGVKH